MKLFNKILALTLAFVCMIGLVACSEKHTHTYTETVVAPTCTESGYTLYTCSCGDSYMDNFTDPLDHLEDENWTVIKEATNTETGEQVKYCSRCGEIVETEVIAIIDAYKVTFVCDDNSSVKVDASQDYTVDPMAKTIAYSVDKTGNYLKDGEV